VKAFLAIIGGFVVSLGMFIGGVVLATTLLTAEPARQPGSDVAVADVWAGEPRVVDVEAQDFERIAALPHPDEQNETDATPTTEMTHAGETEDHASPSLDMVTTASVEPVAEEDPVEIHTASVEPVAEEEPVEINPAGQFPIAHIEWCANQYRSYRASDNSYQPYSGGRRTCVSPYSEDVAVVAPTPSEDDYAVYADDPSYGPVEYASDETQSSIYVTAEHVNDCFSRYRSYRPSDNTYQPYGGGPRRQCR